MNRVIHRLTLSALLSVIVILAVLSLTAAPAWRRGARGQTECPRSAAQRSLRARSEPIDRRERVYARRAYRVTALLSWFPQPAP